MSRNCGRLSLAFNARLGAEVQYWESVSAASYVASCLFFSILMLMCSQAVADSLIASPSTSNVKLYEPNPQVTVTISYSVSNMYGMEVICVADANLFSIQSSSVVSIDPNLANGDSTIVIGPKEKVDDGIYWQVAQSLLPPEYRSGIDSTNTFGQITYDVIATRSINNAEIDCATSLAATDRAESIDLDITNAVFDIDDGIYCDELRPCSTISGTVMLRYQSANLITVKLLNLNTGATVDLSVDETTGEYRFDNVQNSDYRLSYHADHYISDCRSASPNNTDVLIQNFKMTPGDVDNDGDVDFGDYISVLLAYGSRSGWFNYNRAADVNRNGRVNYADIRIVLRNLGASNCG